MSSGWTIDLSGTGQVSGWGDNDYDIRTMEDKIQEKKNVKEKKKKQLIIGSFRVYWRSFQRIKSTSRFQGPANLDFAKKRVSPGKDGPLKDGQLGVGHDRSLVPRLP